MPKLPSVSGKTTLRFLEKRGFYSDHVSGSHHILKHPDRTELRVVVAIHGNRNLPTGTLRAILRQADIGLDEFAREV